MGGAIPASEANEPPRQGVHADDDRDREEAGARVGEHQAGRHRASASGAEPVRAAPRDAWQTPPRI